MNCDLLGSSQPTHAQRAWRELKFGMFVHFGINTFSEVE